MAITKNNGEFMLNLSSELNKERPILFVNIGWSDLYDGLEEIKEGSEWLEKYPTDSMEIRAFVRDENGWYVCGIGEGENIPAKKIHIVFVATDPSDKIKKAVGIYLNAKVTFRKNTIWGIAKSQVGFLFPLGARPIVLKWPTGRNLRRWAFRMGARGKEHPQLKDFFDEVIDGLILRELLDMNINGGEDDQLSANEGELRIRLVNYRKRDIKLRQAKINEVLKSNNGRLICQVPKCGFDFYVKYGELGKDYIHVHHKLPLGKSDKDGQNTTLDDLVVVCANCHAMIHVGGQCRELKDLIP